MEHIVGIDFGTTYSAVALFENGRNFTISNQQGERIFPSAVYIDEGSKVYVGQAAKNVSILHVDRTVMSVKRYLGSRKHFRINDRDFSPERIASYIFRALQKTAEEYTGYPVKKAVVTVPAYYDDRKRQATKRAAKLAGLEVVRLINEPTAAALSCGLKKDEPGIILVYDLGGGTFDVSILQAGGGVFQVLATRGDTRLGGDDFDKKIAEVLIERFYEETKIDLRKDRFALQKVYEEAERAKIGLSERKIVEIEVPFIAADEKGLCHLSTRLTRMEFEELIMGYIEKTIRLTKGAVKDAGLKPADIDRLIFVGGSTRIPVVRTLLTQLFHRDAEGGVSPDETVALGAVVEGAVLAGRLKGVALVDVTPLGLGVENEGDMMVTIVSRNTVLPARVRTIFTTIADDQKSVIIHVLQGERLTASDNISLGAFRLQGIRSARRGEPRIEVSFEIDVEGIVHVSAKDLDTGSSHSISLEKTQELSQDEVGKIIMEARASELNDLQAVGRKHVRK